MKHTATLLAILFAALLLSACKSGKSADQSAPAADLSAVRFNADSAFAFVKAQCDFGARVPNSPAHDRCAAYIVAQFKRYGLQVQEQKTTLKGWDGKQLKCNNIIASYRPELKDRIVLCSHWDSRPWADADPDSSKHREPVMAANDGASGVAVLLEIARQIKEINPSYGVDFVCFDTEDYGAPYWGKQSPDQSDWCLGSRYWASNLPKGYKPRCGILFDMVGGNDARFPFEYFSMKYAQDVVARVWAAAAAVGADNLFVQDDGTMVEDDHIPMNQIAGIPTIDIITNTGTGFSETWHTTRDTPENISVDVLRGVGQTLIQFLHEENNRAK